MEGGRDGEREMAQMQRCHVRDRKSCDHQRRLMWPDDSCAVRGRQQHPAAVPTQTVNPNPRGCCRPERVTCGGIHGRGLSSSARSGASGAARRLCGQRRHGGSVVAGAGRGAAVHVRAAPPDGRVPPGGPLQPHAGAPAPASLYPKPFLEAGEALATVAGAAGSG